MAAAVDSIAPFHLAQESDNVGLLVGQAEDAVTGVLVALDVTEGTIDEARHAGANVVISHHPCIFRPLVTLTESTGPGRRVRALIKAGISHIAAHTNLDAAAGGVNDVLASAVGLGSNEPFGPTPPGQAKVVVFTPEGDVDRVRRAAFAAGAGVIGNYTECSFQTPGTGTFRGGAGAHPAIGSAGVREETAEQRLEVLAPRPRLGAVLAAIRASHSYEEPAIDVYALLDASGRALGRIGNLEPRATGRELAHRLCRALDCGGLLTAGDLERSVGRVAVVSGSGGGLAVEAAARGADCFVTGEITYHQAQDAAEAGLVVLVAGHFATERVVLPRLASGLRAALPGVTVALSRGEADPLRWYGE